MSNSFLFPVSSRPTVDFLDGLAGASGVLTPPYIGGPVNNLGGLPPGIRRGLIRAIEYMAIENIGLEFDFFASAAGLTNLVATDAFISRYQFIKVVGAQFNGTGPYRYYVDGLAIPVYDADSISGAGPTLLHVAVQNVDTVPKTAGAAGAMTATFWIEPMQSF